MQVSTDSYSINPPIWGASTQNFNNWLPRYLEPDSSTTINWGIPIGINDKIHSLLEEYKNFEANWDGEGTEAPDKKVLICATALLRILDKFGQKVFHASPGPNKEIMLDLRNNNQSKSLEILFYPSRSVYVKFQDANKPIQGEFNFEKLHELMTWLNNA
ncbi:MAG TPA: hypothetical protein PKM27_16430 [Saprospiraceae bacterium]|nr:hypothetical protein [Saprospiraceae bacterium]HNT21383.1 hypothetical protein [Saprospiraceae bacterium]